MGFAKWDDSYSLGSETIDGQHKKLINLLNEVAAVGLQGREDMAFTCIGKMEAYAAEHFRDEEKLMRDHGYPDLESHIKLHQEFIERVKYYQGAIYSSYVPFQDILDYLKEWLVKHIAGKDQEYMDYINSK